MDESAVEVAALSEEHAAEIAMPVHNSLESMVDTHFVNLGALFAMSPPSEAHLDNEREVVLKDMLMDSCEKFIMSAATEPRRAADLRAKAASIIAERIRLAM